MEESREWFEKGVTLFEKGEYLKAKSAFDKSIALNPTLAEAWNNRGLALLQMRQYQEALESFNKTLSLNPKHENAKKGKKIALDLLGNQGKPKKLLLNGMKSIRNPFLASGSSFIIPGWGQWYNGRTGDGLKFFGAFLVCFVLLLNFSRSRPSSQSFAGIFVLILFVFLIGIWGYGIYNAYKTADKINKKEEIFSGKSGFFWLPVGIIGASVIAAFIFGIASGVNQNSQITKSFNYTLRGQSGTISLDMSPSVYNNISSEANPDLCIRNDNDTSPCTYKEIHQYYLNFLEEPNQAKYLDNLIKGIKSKTSNEDDQARIAISLVQHIPFDEEESKRLLLVDDTQVKASEGTRERYPYEVLYDNAGVCQEKSLLLAYLLRGLGYGIVLYNFNDERHMAIGIEAPSHYDYNQIGYAFIETTIPSIVTDSQGDYGFGKLTGTPFMFVMSEGKSFSSVEEEYNDAQEYEALHVNAENPEYRVTLSDYTKYKALVNKYGLKP